MLGFVRQGREGEATIGEPHAFSVVAKHLVGGFDDLSLMLRHGLPARFVNAMQ